MKIVLIAAAGLMVFVLAGCSKKNPVLKGEAFFVEWFKSHGETNIVTDKAGVGVAGNPIRLKATLISSEPFNNEGYNVEVEFRVLLPSDDEIIEYVCGLGDTHEQAEKDAYLNFTLTTFHVIYKGFINPDDPHLDIQSIENGGMKREIIRGNLMARGVEDSAFCKELATFEPEILSAITSVPLTEKAHWYKLVCCQAHNEISIAAVVMDNEDHEKLSNTIKALAWPRREEMYVAKQFILVKAAEEGSKDK